MRVLFVMIGMTKEEFLTMPGVKPMLKDFQANQVSWEFWVRGAAKLDFPVKPEVVLTDSIQVAEKLSAGGICCVGYQKPGNTEFFSGAELVLISFLNLDAVFFANIYRRHQGLPVVIAETEHLCIRESAPIDFDELYRISREEGNSDYMETMGSNEEEEREKFLEYIRCMYQFYGFGLWTVEEKKHRRIVGRCGFSVTDEIPGGCVEIGYLIGKKYRRNHFALEACRRILEYAFCDLEISKVYAAIRKKNGPSQELAKKLGFHLSRRKHSEPGTELWIAVAGQTVLET